MNIYLENENHLLCEIIKVDYELYNQINENLRKDKPINKKWVYNPDDKSNKININCYTPTVNNLRLRSSSNLDSKVVKLMKKGEKLEFIEEGKKQTIDKINGTWIKVKTEDGKTGWCFDGYLKKLE